MVKKAPAPKVVEDAKFYTIAHPYPMNVHCEIPEDVNRLCVWIATILGSPDPFFAIHHKPTARGMVIIEIDRDFPPKRLLGEHRWSQILKAPSMEEKGCHSQIFHSLYTKAHQLRDDGWKKIDLKDDNFLDFVPGPLNKIFRHEYPVSHWCPVPKEDVTNKPLCRPLPGAAKPPPPAPKVRVVPGSVEHATGQPSSTDTNSATGGNGNSKNRRRKNKNKNTNTNTTPTNRSPPPPPAAPPIPDSFINDDEEDLAGVTPAAEGIYDFILGIDDGGNMEDVVAPYEQVDDGPGTTQTEAEWRNAGGQTAPEPAANGPWNGQQFTLWVVCSEHPKKTKEECAEAGCVTFLREYKYADKRDKLKATVKCPVCPAKTCKRGICTEYKKTLRKAEQELKEEEKQERIKDNKKSKNGGKKQTGKGSDNAGSGQQGSGGSADGDDDEGWDAAPGNGRGRGGGGRGRMNVAAQAADEGDPWA